MKSYLALASVISLVFCAAPVHAAPSLLAASPQPEASASPTMAPDQAALTILKQTFYDDVRAHRLDDAIAVGRRVLDAVPQDDAFALDFAYALIADGRADEARGLLRRLSASPDQTTAVAAQRQLVSMTSAAPDPAALTPVYAAERSGDYDRAVTLLGDYLSTHPSDCRARLQYAYDLGDLGRVNDEKREFATASGCSDETSAAQARSALARLTAAPGRAPSLTVQCYAQQEGRYADTIFALDVQQKWGSDGDVQPYAIVHVTDDSRSSVAGAGQVFNDNAVSADIGLEHRIGSHAVTFVEGGYSHRLETGASFPEDRIGVRYFQEFGTPDGRRSTTSIGASIANYSRFAGNDIAYLQAQHDARLFGSVRGFLEGSAAFDSRRLFGNNYLEESEGLESLVVPGTTLRVEAVQGRYLGRGLPLPGASTYAGFRAFMSFGFGIK